MSKVHRALENKTRTLEIAARNGEEVKDERLEWFRLANESMEVLDLRLGAVKDWTSQGQLSKDWKETIGRQLHQAESNEDVDKLIEKLPILALDCRSIQDDEQSSMSSSSRGRAASP